MATEPAPIENTPTDQARVSDADELLAQLAAGVDLTDGDDPEAEPLQIPIILTVGGAVIAGDLVSELAWARVKAGENEFFAKLPGMVNREPGEELSRELIGRISYIHLTNAVIYQGSGGVRLKSWRGLISRVDGWDLGRLKQPEGLSDT